MENCQLLMGNIVLAWWLCYGNKTYQDWTWIASLWKSIPHHQPTKAARNLFATCLSKSTRPNWWNGSTCLVSWWRPIATWSIKPPLCCMHNSIPCSKPVRIVAFPMCTWTHCAMPCLLLMCCPGINWPVPRHCMCGCWNKMNACRSCIVYLLLLPQRWQPQRMLGKQQPRPTTPPPWLYHQRPWTRHRNTTFISVWMPVGIITNYGVGVKNIQFGWHALYRTGEKGPEVPIARSTSSFLEQSILPKPWS